MLEEGLHSETGQIIQIPKCKKELIKKTELKYSPKRVLDDAMTTIRLHNNMIMIMADPDFIGNWATEEILREINEKNDAHSKLVT